MDLASKILSDITIFMKYARYRDDLKRRETYEEIVDRNKKMHIEKFPFLESQIEDAYKFVYAKKVLPSARSLQFAGKAIVVNESRIYNCCALPVDHYKAFSETMFLLLGGTGVGFSVQKHHVEKLPPINKPKGRKQKYLIGDSIEGWADSIKVLMKSYFVGGNKISFDYADIRPKGARLVTAGGKAPGPEPLKICHVLIESILNNKNDGDQLSPLECHDILCFIADAVLAGGIRRSAMISLFSADDEEMISSKFGNWSEHHPARARANNSAVFLRHRITKDFFDVYFEKIRLGNSGEPGIFFTNDKDFLCNPCGETALRPYQMCNLCEINASNIKNQEDYNQRAKAAAFIGTLQASYTNFHYLRSIWSKTTEKEALLGVGMTGVASRAVLSLNMKEVAQIVLEENERVSKLIGINVAARTTLMKPSGTTTLALGCRGSGVHGEHASYYLRRLRTAMNEALYMYLQKHYPELIEIDYFKPYETAIICIPQKGSENAILRTESAIDLLERIKKIYNEWVLPGHRSGANTHNISSTISVGDDEWDDVRNWMWDNRNNYQAITVLPRDYGTYVQPPFEDCTEERYEELMLSLKNIDLSEIIEDNDETELTAEPSCAGGVCALTM